jgi:hypothetical protein
MRERHQQAESGKRKDADRGRDADLQSWARRLAEAPERTSSHLTDEVGRFTRFNGQRGLRGLRVAVTDPNPAPATTPSERLGANRRGLFVHGVATFSNP